MRIEDVTQRNKELTNQEKAELTARIEGMDIEELKLIADILPLEIVHNRIGKELKRLRNLEKKLVEISNFAISIDAMDEEE